MNDRNFLGRGLLSPLRREGADFLFAEGEPLIRSCAWNVLGTRCANADGLGGEIPWRQEFGSRLSQLRYAPLNPMTAELARHYSQDALERWEPRVRLGSVDIEDSAATNTRSVLIGFRVISANVPANMVLLPESEAEVII